MNKIYFAFLIIFFSSCLPTVNYLGSSYPPTREPDVYVDERTIDKPYKIIGKGYPEGFGSLFFKELQKKAVEKAKTKGADAILIQDYLVQNNDAIINSVYRSDSSGKGLITTGSSMLSNGNSVSTHFIILFLKYTDH